MSKFIRVADHAEMVSTLARLQAEGFSFDAVATNDATKTAKRPQIIAYKESQTINVLFNEMIEGVSFHGKFAAVHARNFALSLIAEIKPAAAVDTVTNRIARVKAEMRELAEYEAAIPAAAEAVEPVDQAPRVFVVSADHVAARYQLDQVRFAVDSHAEAGRVGFYAGRNGAPAEYWANLAGFGCGRSHATPEKAIRDLLRANGCQNIRIEELKPAAAEAVEPAAAEAVEPAAAEAVEPAAANECRPCTWSELTEYEKSESNFRGFPRGDDIRYITKRKYDQENREMSLVRWTRVYDKPAAAEIEPTAAAEAVELKRAPYATKAEAVAAIEAAGFEMERNDSGNGDKFELVAAGEYPGMYNHHARPVFDPGAGHWVILIDVNRFADLPAVAEEMAAAAVEPAAEIVRDLCGNVVLPSDPDFAECKAAAAQSVTAEEALREIGELLQDWPTMRALSASGAEKATANKQRARELIAAVLQPEAKPADQGADLAAALLQVEALQEEAATLDTMNAIQGAFIVESNKVSPVFDFAPLEKERDTSGTRLNVLFRMMRVYQRSEKAAGSFNFIGVGRITFAQGRLAVFKRRALRLVARRLAG